VTEWAERYRDAERAFEQARELQVRALRLRCPQMIGLGMTLRCTADELPFHVHRYIEAEVPAVLADEEAWRR